MKRGLLILWLATCPVTLAQPSAEGPAQPEVQLVRDQREAGLAHLERGDVAEALSSFRASLKLAREISDQPAIADNLLSIGLIHLQAGRYPAAVTTLERALDAAREPNARNDVADIELALSEAYAAAGRHAEAYRALRRVQDARGDGESEAEARVASLSAELEDARRQIELAASQPPPAKVTTPRDQTDPDRRFRRLQIASVAIGGLAMLLLLLSWLARRRLHSHLSRVIADRDLELRQATENLQQATDQLESTQTELEATDRQLQQTKLDFDRSQHELEHATTSLLDAHTKLEQATFELNRATSDQEQSEAKLSRMTHDFDLASTLLERKAVQLAETSTELEQHRATLDQASKKLERTRAELDGLKGSYATDIAALGDRNAVTRDRLAEMESFTSAVSQHLKVLLISIRSSLGALQQDAAAGDLNQLKADVNRTHDAVGRVVRLLDKLLKLLLVGRMVNAPTEVPMSELAYEAAGQVTGLVADRRAEIVIAPDLPTAIGDRAQLLEVLRNLLENSGKFMGTQPAPRIDVTSRQEVSNSGSSETVFLVRDNGIGIDLRDHERIFTLFERLDSQQEGVGLGLGLVKRILDAHGGRIWVESEGKGLGSTFCFTVPDDGAKRRPVADR